MKLQYAGRPMPWKFPKSIMLILRRIGPITNTDPFLAEIKSKHDRGNNLLTVVDNVFDLCF